MKKKKKRKKLSDAQRQEGKFRRDILTVFRESDFTHISSEHKQIVLAGRRGEFDGVFLFKNIIVLEEHTTLTDSSRLTDHLRKKNEFFQFALEHRDDLMGVLGEVCPEFARHVNSQPFGTTDYRIIPVYCPLNDIPVGYRGRYPSVVLLEHRVLMYFVRLVRAIKKSARFELLKFLRMELGHIGVAQSGSDFQRYDGLLLSASPSGFPSGHKLVSFLMDPQTLIERAYVLRVEGWYDQACLYQRMLAKNKLTQIRRYLGEEGRVFVNNIIVTLPDETHVKEINGPFSNQDITPVHITLPRQLQTIGIIDGQHRVFSYHEGNDAHESVIAELRDKQHLLVTGIVYPSNMSGEEKTEFEAGLFLEINDKQTRTKSGLRQAIEVITRPFSAVAIAKAVITKMADEGSLAGELERDFFDTTKIKTASIVSYGLRHVVAIDGKHSLFQLLPAGKQRALRKQTRSALDRYVAHCVCELDYFFSAFKQTVPTDMWTRDKKTSRALTTTTINGVIYCFRRLVQDNRVRSYDYYRRHLRNIHIDYRPTHFPYKSSHWRALGEEIYEQCFAKS